MREFDPATLDLLGGRRGLEARRLVWIAARNRQTGIIEGLGLCTGADDLTVSVAGVARTYLGVGALLESEPITAGAGLTVRIHQLRLAAIDGRVEDLVKGYETRFADVDIHRAIFDPETGAMAGPPHRVFRGLVNALDFPTGAVDGSPACIIEVVSETRALTRTLPTKKSDDSHQARGGDRFRRYAEISGAVPVYWNELRSDPTPSPTQGGGASDGGGARQ
jgi:hypothetical protein